MVGFPSPAVRAGRGGAARETRPHSLDHDHLGADHQERMCDRITGPGTAVELYRIKCVDAEVGFWRRIAADETPLAARAGLAVLPWQ